MEDKELKESIASLMKDKTQREAFAEMLVEYVQPEHIATDFISLLLDTRNLKPGDLLVKKLRKNNARVRTLVPGSIHLKDEITVQDRINYILDGADIGITANYWELEGGQIGTVDEIRTELLAKLRDFYIGKVFTALTTIWTAANTPLNYTAVNGALNETALKAAIDYINQTTGGAKAIVGVRSALTPVTTFGAFWSDGTTLHTIPSRIEEVMRDGWLGSFYGVPILTVPQNFDNPADHNALIPTDKVLVIGNKVGEFITYGTPQSKQWDDMRPTPPQWNFEFYQQFGMIVDKAEGIYVLGALS